MKFVKILILWIIMGSLPQTIILNSFFVQFEVILKKKGCRLFVKTFSGCHQQVSNGTSIELAMAVAERTTTAKIFAQSNPIYSLSFIAKTFRRNTEYIHPTPQFS